MVSRDDIKDRVQQATDIVELIGEAIALRPAGREFKALCPFHDDTNPSMAVVPQKQIFHCFVCQTGGDVFSWMMKFHRMSFPEALRHLADRAGIELPRHAGAANAAGASERERIAQANERALRYFRAQLKDPANGRIAREYLASRGINEAMIEAFELGCSPDTWDSLAQAIAKKQWAEKDFEDAGLISQRERGGYFDRLRHRLIFPILDGLSRPIAFGGRVLPDGQRDDKSDAKYLNSPETALFHKSSTLYGLHLAKQPIIRSRTAVIVEGYTDVIAAHQAGQANVVATLGTAFTPEHVGQLRHIADRVVLVFDGDEAGQRAAESAVRVFLSDKLDVAVAILPGGQDPADLLATDGGVEIWQRMIAEAADALDYLFARMKGRYDAAETLAARQRIAEEFLAQLSTLGLAHLADLRRAMVLQKLSGMLGIGQNELNALLAKVRPSRAPRPAPEAQPAGEPPLDDSVDEVVALADERPRIKALEQAERQLIGCLLREPALFHEPLADGRNLDETLPPTMLLTPDCRRLGEWMYEWLAHDAITLAQVLGELAQRDEPGLAALATGAEQEIERLTGEDADAVRVCFDNVVQRILRGSLEPEYRRMRERLLAGGDAGHGADEDALLEAIQKHHLRRSAAAPGAVTTTGG